MKKIAYSIFLVLAILFICLDIVIAVIVINELSISIISDSYSSIVIKLIFGMELIGCTILFICFCHYIYIILPKRAITVINNIILLAALILMLNEMWKIYFLPDFRKYSKLSNISTDMNPQLLAISYILDHGFRLISISILEAFACISNIINFKKKPVPGNKLSKIPDTIDE